MEENSMENRFDDTSVKRIPWIYWKQWESEFINY